MKYLGLSGRQLFSQPRRQGISRRRNLKLLSFSIYDDIERSQMRQKICRLHDLGHLLERSVFERVSKSFPYGDLERGGIEEGAVRGEQMFVTNQQAAEMPLPGVGAFDLPASLVASQFPAIFASPPDVEPNTLIFPLLER
ncbi:MAG: hypothetical protein WCA10_11480 [Terracidiphilus sp.]